MRERFVADQNPAEIGGGISQPGVDVGDESVAGPGIGIEPADSFGCRGNGHEIAAIIGPECGIEDRMVPGGIARRGRGADPFGVGCARCALSPVPRDPVQRYRCLASHGPIHRQAQRSALYGCARRQPGNIKFQQRATHRHTKILPAKIYRPIAFEFVFSE